MPLLCLGSCLSPLLLNCRGGRSKLVNLSHTFAALLVFALACTVALFMHHHTLKSFAFPARVFAFVAGSMVWPQAFGTWLECDLQNLVVPLVQIIMFGMGTKLSIADFVRVFVMPWPVFIGLVLHYTVMPLTGFAIARIFAFPPEVAAGVILVGSVSSGAASNLIVYLARTLEYLASTRPCAIAKRCEPAELSILLR